MNMNNARQSQIRAGLFKRETKENQIKKKQTKNPKPFYLAQYIFGVRSTEYHRLTL